MNESQNIRKILRCPNCHSSLTFFETQCTCKACNQAFRISSGKYYFREVQADNDSNDAIDRVKYKFKVLPKVYNKLLIDVLSPVLPNKKHEKILRNLSGTIVNIGSGTRVIGDKVINIDMFDYDNVSIVADIHRLPFGDCSVDAVFSIAVLEHVQRPQDVVAEILRVLKINGVIFTMIPFMQPYHASPHDYNRYSLSGIKYFHRDFQEIDAGVYGGPVSGFLWVFQEFVAMLFSFGSVTVRNVISIIVMTITFPLKYLDFIFRRLRTANNIASSFYFYGRKTKEVS